VTLPLIKLRLQQIRWEAQDICAYEFVAANGQALPPFTAGAHIDLHLPVGGVCSYSLCGSPEDRAVYRVAVQREAQGRGASRWLHDQARVGMVLEAAGPHNDFALCETASASVFIAGGIGVTPILSMIARLEVLGRPWTLHYATRSRERTAFADALARLDGGRGWVHHAVRDEGHARLPIQQIVSAAPVQAHLYCCGPAGMVDDFVQASQTRKPETVHLERFAASQQAATSGGYEAVLAKSGGRVQVSPGQTLLDALLDANVSVSYACSNGICGTCVTRVLQGTPDHRDDFLTPEEKQSGQTMLVCRSGSLTPEIVLDL
jgi:vanillate O-demethylase ferredoxin subunit